MTRPSSVSAPKGNSPGSAYETPGELLSACRSTCRRARLYRSPRGAGAAGHPVPPLVTVLREIREVPFVGTFGRDEHQGGDDPRQGRRELRRSPEALLQ